MGTTATTITGAIAEHESDISSLSDQIKKSFRSDGGNLNFSGDLNNVNLIGCYFGNRNNISNLPLEVNTTYVFIIAYGHEQIVHEYTSEGFGRSFQRGYINSQWYPWTDLRKVQKKTISVNGVVYFDVPNGKSFFCIVTGYAGAIFFGRTVSDGSFDVF